MRYVFEVITSNELGEVTQNKVLDGIKVCLFDEALGAAEDLPDEHPGIEVSVRLLKEIEVPQEEPVGQEFDIVIRLRLREGNRTDPTWSEEGLLPAVKEAELREDMQKFVRELFEGDWANMLIEFHNSNFTPEIVEVSTTRAGVPGED